MRCRLGDARLCGTTASLCGIESARQEETYEKLDRALRLDLTLHACMFTLSGIPVLYAGDEIGQENDYGYHDDPMKAADSNARGPPVSEPAADGESARRAPRL